MPARDRRDGQGCTYPCYKIGESFILHYPGKVRRRRGGGVAVVYLGWPLLDVTGCTLHCSPARQVVEIKRIVTVSDRVGNVGRERLEEKRASMSVCSLDSRHPLNCVFGRLLRPAGRSQISPAHRAWAMFFIVRRQDERVRPSRSPHPLLRLAEQCSPPVRLADYSFVLNWRCFAHHSL